MLLNSVIIILREVLEAAILVSVMLSLSHYYKISFSWLKWSLAMGICGAIVYAYNVAVISNWLDGVGQEVLNASLQYLIYILLAGFCIWLISKPSHTPISLKIVSRIMAISISLSMVREFSEILIYLHVFSQGSATMMPVMIGAFLGAGIGLSVGVILYHFLNFLSHKWSFRMIFVVLSFIAAGMLSQATQLLIQADWLPSQHPIWNTSAWISERSIVGQLLYAIFGYEATPTLIQVSVYFIGLFIILTFILKRFWSNQTHLKNTKIL
jgi:high-affinity iron transporter